MFAWFQRLLPKTGNFFEMFEAHAQTVTAGADALSRLLQDGPGSASDHIREVIERENDADEITRSVLKTSFEAVVELHPTSDAATNGSAAANRRR